MYLTVSLQYVPVAIHIVTNINNSIPTVSNHFVPMSILTALILNLTESCDTFNDVYVTCSIHDSCTIMKGPAVVFFCQLAKLDMSSECNINIANYIN